MANERAAPAAETMHAAPRPTLPPPRRAANSTLLDQAITATMARGFDADLFHVMEREDEALIRDEILHGASSGAFVYSFQPKGADKPVTGISVIGAAQLAAKYGGIKHHIIATIEKRGALFTFRAYPTAMRGMDISVKQLHELADEMDFFTAVVEVESIKNGNSIQVEVSEWREETRRDGSTFARPHFQRIAQSKAYRNGVLRIVPQDVQIEFKRQCLDASDGGKSKDVSASVIDEKRAAIVAYAVKNSVPIHRDGVFDLGWSEISGLSDAAREGRLPAFVQAAQALNILGAGIGYDPATGEVDAPATTGDPGQKAPAEAKPRGRPPGSTKAKADQAPATGPTGPEPPPPTDQRGDARPASGDQREQAPAHRSPPPPPPPADTRQAVQTEEGDQSDFSEL